MSIDVISKFLKVSENTSSAQNDNYAEVEFAPNEKNYIANLTQQYGVTSRTYAEQGGERIDIFLNAMGRHYNLPSVCLIKRPALNGRSDYHFITTGHDGFDIPSNSFGFMQSSLSKFLMRQFQRRGLRTLDT